MNVTIQFSGGRTSGYMLWRQLKNFGGTLPSNYQVLFENTGKEREETLEFIEEVSQRWSVPVIWLEYDDVFDPLDYMVFEDDEDGYRFKQRKTRQNFYRVVDFKTASRNGEPFLKLLRNLKEYRRVVKNLEPLLPNVRQRLCTAYLKVKTSQAYLFDQGWEEWVIMMGIRADEAHRAAKMFLYKHQTLSTPLIEEGITKQHIGAFWDASDFDLRLDANSDLGNCDLCFLKAQGKLIQIMTADRTREAWWIGVEKEFNNNFGRGRRSFQELARMIDTNDPKMEKLLRNQADKSIDCFCGE